MMFSQDKVKKALELDERYRIIALMPVGYPDQDPSPRSRLALEDIIIKEM